MFCFFWLTPRVILQNRRKKAPQTLAQCGQNPSEIRHKSGGQVRPRETKDKKGFTPVRYFIPTGQAR